MSTDDLHEMREPEIDKIVVHMSIGEGGRELSKAEEILEEVTGQESVRTEAKISNPEFEIREGDPIGCKVTLRGEKATEFLERAFGIVESIPRTNFDEYGDFSFGIKEHTDFEEMEYDPEIGIYGMDVTVSMTRSGKRIERRNRASRSLPRKQRLNIQDAVDYISERFEVEIA